MQSSESQDDSSRLLAPALDRPSFTPRAAAWSCLLRLSRYRVIVDNRGANGDARVVRRSLGNPWGGWAGGGTRGTTREILGFIMLRSAWASACDVPSSSCKALTSPRKHTIPQDCYSSSHREGKDDAVTLGFGASAIGLMPSRISAWIAAGLESQMDDDGCMAPRVGAQCFYSYIYTYLPT